MINIERDKYGKVEKGSGLMKNKQNYNGSNMVIGLCIGVSIGISLGLVMDSLIAGIAIGASVGLALGVAYSKEDDK